MRRFCQNCVLTLFGFRRFYIERPYYAVFTVDVRILRRKSYQLHVFVQDKDEDWNEDQSPLPPNWPFNMGWPEKRIEGYVTGSLKDHMMITTESGTVKSIPGTLVGLQSTVAKTPMIATIPTLANRTVSASTSNLLWQTVPSTRFS